MKDAEAKAAAERLAELERIAIQKEADDIFQRNELEKKGRKRTDAEVLAKFHLMQAVSKLQTTRAKWNELRDRPN